MRCPEFDFIVMEQNKCFQKGAKNVQNAPKISETKVPEIHNILLFELPKFAIPTIIPIFTSNLNILYMITISLSYYYLDLSFYDSSLISVPRLLCGTQSVIFDVLCCQEVDCNHLEAHGLMYNDKSSDYSEQLCSPRNYSVSDKEVMNCKDPSSKNEVNNSSLYNLLPIIFSVTLHFTLILNISILLFLVILSTRFNNIFIFKDD